MINTDLMLEKIVDETNFDGKIAIILGSGLSIISDKIKEHYLNETRFAKTFTIFNCVNFYIGFTVVNTSFSH